jgi:hypothetical protein
LFLRVRLRENLLTLRLHRVVRFIILAAAFRCNAVETKLPLSRESSRIRTKCIVDPGRLTITDSDKANMHGLAISSRKVTG